MSPAPLVRALVEDPALRPTLDAVTTVGLPALDITVAAPARAAVVAAVVAGTGRPALAVTSTAREAEDLCTALGCLLDPATVAEFPAWETLPHERLSPRSDTVGRRLAVLRRLAHPDAEDPAYGPLDVVVAPVRALLQPIASGLGELVPVSLRVGEERALEDVVEALATAAYARTDLVERGGRMFG